MHQNARRIAVLGIFVFGLAACSASDDYADPSIQGASAESRLLPTVASQAEETMTPIDDTEAPPSTIDDLPVGEGTTQDQPEGSPSDDEVTRANQWNGSNLGCADFAMTDIPITGSDPNGLDREGDGVGCES